MNFRMFLLLNSTCSTSSVSSTDTGFSSRAKNTAMPITCKQNTDRKPSVNVLYETIYRNLLNQLHYFDHKLGYIIPSFSMLTNLERLQYEDALEEGEAQRHDPLDGLVSAVLKTVQEGEVGGHCADGQQQEPAQEHTPPRQPAAPRPPLLLFHGRWAGPRRGKRTREKWMLQTLKNSSTILYTTIVCFHPCLFVGWFVSKHVYT